MKIKKFIIEYFPTLLAFIIIYLVLFALINTSHKIDKDMEKNGGVGKTIGIFINDIKSEIK